jgi:hypothetical protein
MFIVDAINIIIRRNLEHHCWEWMTDLSSHTHWADLPLSEELPVVVVKSWLQGKVSGPVNLKVELN